MVLQDRHYRFAVVFCGYEPHARSFETIRQNLFACILTPYFFDICYIFVN